MTMNVSTPELRTAVQRAGLLLDASHWSRAIVGAPGWPLEDLPRSYFTSSLDGFKSKVSFLQQSSEAERNV